MTTSIVTMARFAGMALAAFGSWSYGTLGSGWMDGRMD